MEDSSQKKWSQRVNWANCREPYKSDLDGLATMWIQGQISNAELALELWLICSKKRFAETTKNSPAVPSELNVKVQEEIEILVEAMRMAENMETTTPAERRELLELSLAHGGRREELQR